MQIDHLQSLLILFGKRAFFEAVAKKKSIPKRRSMSAWWHYEALMETLQHMNHFSTLTVGKCKNVTHDAGVPQFSGASLLMRF